MSIFWSKNLNAIKKTIMKKNFSQKSQNTTLGYNQNQCKKTMKLLSFKILELIVLKIISTLYHTNDI